MVIQLKKYKAIFKEPKEKRAKVVVGDLIIEYKLKDGTSNTAISVLNNQIEGTLKTIEGSVFIEASDPSLSDFQRIYSEGYFECIAVDSWRNMWKEVADYLNSEWPMIEVLDIYFT